MKFNKKSFLKSLYKVSTVLFLVGYNFAPPFLAIDQLRDIGGEITPVAAADGPYTISSTSGIWTSVSGGSNITGLNTKEIRWGKPVGSQKSGLRFDGKGETTFNANETFLIGDFTHFNWATQSGTSANGATLNVTLNFSNPVISPSPTFTYDFDIDETPNRRPCGAHQQSTTPCDDIITFPNGGYGEQVYTIGDMKYTLKIDGFQDSKGNTLNRFVTEEQKNNVAYLVGRLSSVLVERPAISIVKEVNGQDANTLGEAVQVNAGDTVNFTYIVQNTGNVKLTNIAVTDDKGVQVTCPGTELEPGTNMTCTGSATAIAGNYTNIGTVTSSHNLSASDPANYKGIIPTIKICHRTKSHTSPYEVIEPDASGNLNGHAGHTGDIWFPGITVEWGDIIPPFTSYDGIPFTGLNWSEYGQAIYNNNCIIPQGQITVKKVLSPASNNDNTEFTITGSGTPSINGSPTFLYEANSNIGKIRTTKSHTYNVMPGTYNITETLPAGWSLVSNTCSNITITNNETKECTITNTQDGSLTIVKKALPFGTDTFGFTLTGGNGVNEQFNLVDNSDTEDPSKTFSLKAGTYAVAENNYSDWKTTYSCTDGKTIDNISLSAGESVTCTFTNTKYGSISGRKLHDLDGLASTTNDRKPVYGYTIFIDKDGDGKLDTTTEPHTTTALDGSYSFTGLEPGEYTVVEVMKVGWIVLPGTSTSWTIKLSPGEDKKNVDFINIERPTIKVIKFVDTDGDGEVDDRYVTDWTWMLDDKEYKMFGKEEKPMEIMPGTYAISEIQKDDYTVKSMMCDNGGVKFFEKPTESTKLTINSGDKILCRFINTRDTGTLIVRKEVINDNGGKLEAREFSFKIGTSKGVGFDQDPTNPLLGENIYKRYPTGTYSIIEPEANQRGYATTYDNCDKIIVEKGKEAVCTITNDDVAPTLTVIKRVVNDNGGTATANDFGIKLNGDELKFKTWPGEIGKYTSTYFATPEVKSNTKYELEEIDHPGYKEGKWSCTDDKTGKIIGSYQFSLTEGQRVTCTITNDDIAPSLELVKEVDNKYGGNAQITDWTLTATGPTTISGDSGVKSGGNFKAGTYTLSEIAKEGISGYEAGDWDCTNDIVVDDNNQITLEVGQTTVCTIKNTEIQPTLTLVKTVENNHGGLKQVADFKLYIGDTEVTSGKAHKVNSGVEYTVREDQLPGYTASTWSGDCSADGKITLSSGENKTCTITNSDSQSKITVIKKVINDHGGTATVDDFDITLTDSTLEFDAGVEEGDTTTYTATVFGDVNKEYTLSETVAGTGYTMDSLECSLGSDGVFTLPEGQNVTCTIVNNDIQPTLTVEKVVDNGTYGDKQVSDFTLYVSGNKVTSGEVNKFNAGDYTVSEDNLDGYVATFSDDCDSDGNVTLNVGDNKVCTITNKSTHGKIIIKKLVEPRGDKTKFTFTGELTGTIGNNGTIEKVVIPGDYSVTEQFEKGWNLKSLVCDDTDSVRDGYTANIKVGDNETVTCTFTNEKLGSISGFKYEDRNGNGKWDVLPLFSELPLRGWTIFIDLDNDGVLDVGEPSTITNILGYYEFTNLPVGETYIIREVQKDGWTQTSANPAPITIAAGDVRVLVNFGNFKDATINVTKDVVGVDGKTNMIDTHEFTALLNNDEGTGQTIAEGTTATYKVANGKHTISEVEDENYTTLGCFISKKEFTNYSVRSGETYNVVCKNAQLPATLIVTKDVVNSEGEDVDGDIFSDDLFDVVLGEVTEQIADTSNGKQPAVFEGLQPGVHSFTETPKEGYTFGGCVNDEGVLLDGEVILGSNQTLEVECINKVIDPILQIEKSNDAVVALSAGDIVTYTITVTAPSDESEGTYVLNNVVVSDIAPAGFKYILDSWIAQKNGVGISVPEPIYDDKGQAKWNIGDMKEGDKVVLTYKTKISLDQDPGNYPDIAWVAGTSLIDGEVLGASTVDPETPFVGTDVTVIEPVETEEGEVLGASITLPVTGASTYLTLGALIMMILGAITLLLKPFKKLSYALLTGLMAISFVTLLTPNRVLALDSDIKVRIMQPATPTNKSSFNVGFVALDLNNNSITVECYKDAEVAPFATFTANTGNCPVTVSASGTYTFYVVAKSTSGEQKSADVTVVVDLEKPAPVIDYSKAGNVIKFKTPNDPKIKTVEIHRSDKPSYTANESTRIHPMPVSPNTEYSWTDTTAEAGKTYYYALRTVDALGNVSTIVSDPEVIEVPKISTPTATTTTTTTTTGGEVAGQKDTTDEGEVAGEKDDVLEVDDQEVEKTEDSEEKTDGDVEETGKKVLGKWYIWVIAIVVLGGVAYYVRKQKRN
ncbi:MAG: THxN family PEP-CTERM protein [Candidatus Dojkabacteria bacterium]